MNFEFKFPDVGEGIHEGTIIKWLVEEGDQIKEGDSLVEVETDKVTTEIPSPKTGKVLELKGEAGDVIHVGNVFVIIETEGGSASDEKVEDSKSPDSPDGPKDTEAVGMDGGEEEEETAGVVGEIVASSEEIPASNEGQKEKTESKEKRRVLATPVARKMAKDLGVDISTVEGSGPNGRVMKDDIRKAADAKKDQPKESQVVSKEQTRSQEVSRDGEENVERIPLTRIRKTIAEKMSQSRFTIPHTTAMDEIDISKLVEFRKKYKDQLREEDVNLTYLPFIIKAVLAGLKEFPEFNAELDEENEELVLKYFYNIGLAADTERGLMVPVIRDADKKNIIDLSKAIVDLGNRAKDNKLDLEELQRGTFTITNYGSIGGHFGIPIINHPESAILGVGRAVKKPIVKDDEIVVATILPLSLSYDHRTIDGASGSRFLNLLKELLSDPEILLLRS